MKNLLNFFLGITFGFGLILSNLFDPKTMSLFFNFNSEWNPSILFTVGGIILASITFLIFIKFKFKEKSVLSQKNQINDPGFHVVGSAIFGVGWGLSGFCVSTAAMNLAFNQWESLLFFFFMIAGFYGPKFIKKITL